MRRFIEIFLVMFLLCFSFFYTDKIIKVVNKKNPLMIQISNVKYDYEIASVDAVIDDDTIIPGINGRIVDVYDSYENMKLGGIFREEELVFKDLFPDNSLKNNKNKYIISGNKNKKEVAILCIFNNNYLNKLKKIDNVTIFFNHSDITISNISLLKNKEIYTYGNNGLYGEELITNDNTLINRVSNNKSKYCLTKNKNDDVLEICDKNNMYTILPNIIGGYYDVKSKLTNGSIILLENINDYNVVVRYINSKGYKIVDLDELISE